MERKKKYHDLTTEQEKIFFSRLEISYGKTKNDVWDSLKEVIDKEQTPVRHFDISTYFNRAKLSAAAAIFILLGLSFFAKYYTTSVIVTAGEFVTHTTSRRFAGSFECRVFYFICSLLVAIRTSDSSAR